MDGTTNIREGMQVYSSDERLIGPVEKVERTAIRVKGREIADSAIARVVQGRVYLTGVYDETAGATGAAQTTIRDEGTVRVPVYEERLDIQKREGELGEVRLHKTVEEEQVAVPVELRREEVKVEQRAVDARPVEPELRNTYRDRWGSGRDRWQELREEIREAYNRARK